MSCGFSNNPRRAEGLTGRSWSGHHWERVADYFWVGGDPEITARRGQIGHIYGMLRGQVRPSNKNAKATPMRRISSTDVSGGSGGIPWLFSRQVFYAGMPRHLLRFETSIHELEGRSLWQP